MKAVDYLINLMDHSSEEGHYESLSMVLLTGFMALMVIMLIV